MVHLTHAQDRKKCIILTPKRQEMTVWWERKTQGYASCEEKLEEKAKNTIIDLVTIQLKELSSSNNDMSKMF